MNCKRIISVMLSVLMLISLIPTAVFAEEASVVASGSCGENVNYTLYGSGLLEISGSGPMTDFYGDSICPEYKNYRDRITQVEISEGVTSIGEYAFMSFGDIKRVNIASSVETIGGHAFEHCYGIEIVTIAEGLINIDSSAFADCTSLVEIVLPESVTTIGSSAFLCCFTLTDIVIPANVTSIGDEVFNLCPALENITFLGDAPQFGGTQVFPSSSDAQVNYPCNNDTWTEDILSMFGDNVSWSVNHVAGEIVDVVDPTCANDGYSVYICENCQNEFASNAIPAYEHTYTDGVCSECGEIEILNKGIVAVEASTLYIPTD